MGTDPLFVVLDIETTGLDPRPYLRDLRDGRHAVEGGDDILEVGAILVSSPHSTFSALVRRTKPMDQIDPYVVGMHTKNGLWRDLEQRFGAQYASEADLSLATWLCSHGAIAGDGHGKNASGNVVLVGYSVHFDHTFLKSQWPETAKLLSHRVRDVGQFVSQCTEWGLPVPPKAGNMPHRALPDAEIELAQYLGLRDALQAMARPQLPELPWDMPVPEGSGVRPLPR